jgi:hypothetical protein
MVKQKQISEKDIQFAKGGKGPENHMVPQQHAGLKGAGIGGKQDQNDGGKFAKGGTATHIPQAAKPARAGCSYPE